MSAAPQSVLSAARPFPGLRPFAYQDHDYFFGREDQVFSLYRLIDRNRLIAVIGSSGCGKSSLVRAGLMPLLEEETSGPGGRNWLWREMRPGDAPLERLTSLFAGLAKNDDPIIASARRERVAAHLRRSSFGVAEALTEIGGLGDQSLVLVVDQFEELFRYSPSGASGDDAEDARAREAATKFVQLLLEAARAREHRLLVMLTMRSDFLGDCARFHGLPEAVSATQFLVPSLTRDQLEDVIRKPVAKAGADIEPELVERLLNDCSTELDQLPVLQHCLLRLWEEAGRRPAAEAGAAVRRLTIAHYRKIGSFAGALSQHANELLDDLPGPKLQLAVEQTFRALSELDKEGRATRRPLRFAQLLAEAGAEQSDLCRVLDRFRADDCSFLVPPHFETPAIEATTRIDVGHEALLRRWEKVSGHGNEPGWLRVEQQAGERYRGLLAIAEGEDATLPAHLVDERWAWWIARPRTPAWAERYGGGFDRVERLLRASKRRRRLVRIGMAAGLAGALVLAAVMARLWLEAEAAQKRVAEIHKTALQGTVRTIAVVWPYVLKGSIPPAEAQRFLDQTKATVEALRANQVEQTADIRQLGTTLSLYISDTHQFLQQPAEALTIAENAEKETRQLLAKDPENPDLQVLAFESAYRIGDLDERRSESEYRTALDYVTRLNARFPGRRDYQRKLAFIANKIGDVYQTEKNWTAALEQYQKSLQIDQTLAQRFPDELQWPIDTAVAQTRIGRVKVQMADAKGALEQLQAALATQDQLLKQDPKNDIIASNERTTYRTIGEASKLAGKYDDSLKAFQAAVEIGTRLYAKDPKNTLSGARLAGDNASAGDVLVIKKDWPKAVTYFRASRETYQKLASGDPSNAAWQRSLASVQKKLDDASAKANGGAGTVKQEGDALR